MSRAAFPMRTLADLRKMTLRALDQYIAELRVRAEVLGGPAQKATRKHLAVAEKERASR
jgi:hypothetical protein